MNEANTDLMEAWIRADLMQSVPIRYTASVIPLLRPQTDLDSLSTNLGDNWLRIQMLRDLLKAEDSRRFRMLMMQRMGKVPGILIRDALVPTVVERYAPEKRLELAMDLVEEHMDASRNTELFDVEDELSRVEFAKTRVATKVMEARQMLMDQPFGYGAYDAALKATIWSTKVWDHAMREIRDDDLTLVLPMPGVEAGVIEPWIVDGVDVQEKIELKHRLAPRSDGASIKIAAGEDRVSLESENKKLIRLVRFFLNYYGSFRSRTNRRNKLTVRTSSNRRWT